MRLARRALWEVRRPGPLRNLATEAEIIDQLQQRLGDDGRGFDPLKGKVVGCKDGLAIAVGLEGARTNEVVTFDGGGRGLVLSTERTLTRVGLLDNHRGLAHGTPVTLSQSGELRFPVGPEISGRVLSPLGVPLDGKGTIPTSTPSVAILRRPPHAALTARRERVRAPLWTGIEALDVAHPLGRGQRIAFVGPGGSGKRDAALEAIRCAVCTQAWGLPPLAQIVYVLVGVTERSLSHAVGALEESGALEHGVVIATSRGDTWLTRYLAPYAGMAAGEWWRDVGNSGSGEDSVLVLDAMGSHLESHRAMMHATICGDAAMYAPSASEDTKLVQSVAPLFERAGPVAGGGTLSILALLDTPPEGGCSALEEAARGIADDTVRFTTCGSKRWGVEATDLMRPRPVHQPALARRLSLRLLRRIAKLARVENNAKLAREFGLDHSTEFDGTNEDIAAVERLRSFLDNRRPLDEKRSVGRQLLSLFAATEGTFDSNEQVVFESDLHAAAEKQLFGSSGKTLMAELDCCALDEDLDAREQELYAAMRQCVASCNPAK